MLIPRTMSVMNRKGKIIFLYDFNLKLKWSGVWVGTRPLYLCLLLPLTLLSGNDGEETKIDGFVSITDIADDETPTVWTFARSSFADWAV